MLKIQNLTLKYWKIKAELQFCHLLSFSYHDETIIAACEFQILNGFKELKKINNSKSEKIFRILETVNPKNI